MGAAREFGERTGGMRYDAPDHGALMERVRSLDARPGLPAGAREMVDVVLGYDERRGRERGGAFPEAAERVAGAREEMSPSAGPDGIGEREEKSREPMAREEQARIAAEEERRAAEQARIDDIFARAAERARAAAEEEREEREAANRRNRATPPSHEESQHSARAAREATRLADRLDACLERRDTLLERAEGKLEYNRPVVDLGRVHARWRREADRAIEAGRELVQDERYAPHLDAFGGREKIEAALARLKGARVLDHLPARIAAEWEKLEDRTRETGSHRFFLPEHESACARMDRVYRRDDVAHRFVKDELGMRERMGRHAETLGDVENRLKECASERERAVRRDIRFVRQEGYARLAFPRPRGRSGRRTRSSPRRRNTHRTSRRTQSYRETLKTVSATLGRVPRWRRAWNGDASWTRRIETERQPRLEKEPGPRLLDVTACPRDSLSRLQAKVARRTGNIKNLRSQGPDNHTKPKRSDCVLLVWRVSATVLGERARPASCRGARARRTPERAPHRAPPPAAGNAAGGHGRSSGTRRHRTVGCLHSSERSTASSGSSSSSPNLARISL